MCLLVDNSYEMSSLIFSEKKNKLKKNYEYVCNKFECSFRELKPHCVWIQLCSVMDVQILEYCNNPRYWDR